MNRSGENRRKQFEAAFFATARFTSHSFGTSQSGQFLEEGANQAH
jgi:hypothetical protein